MQVDGHAPVYAQGRCQCGYKPTWLSEGDPPESWDAAIDMHIARFITSWAQTP